MDGVFHEKVVELFGSIVCTYRNLIIDYSAACGAGGCGDYPEYVSFHDDPGDHDDHPGAAGVFYISVTAFDYHLIPAGNQCVYYQEYSDQLRILRTDHQSVW